MEKKTFVVPNIGCDGCVRTVKNELGEIEGVQRVEGDVQTKQVMVEFIEPASWGQIVDKLKEIDYAPAEEAV